MKQTQRSQQGTKAKRTKKAAGSREMVVSSAPMAMAKSMLLNPEVIEETVAAGLDSLGAKLGAFSEGVADEALTQSKETVHHAVVAANQIKLAVDEVRATVESAKITFGTVKDTAKRLTSRVRENPEPFIAAAIPAVVGLVMLAQKMRTRSTALNA